MLSPRHILITGASSGIGAALALLYATPGIRLSLQGRNTERLDEVATRAQEKGASVSTMTLDVTDANLMSSWIRDCDRRQPLDLVIVNAGISAGTGGHGVSETQSRMIFATNFTGVLNTVHPILPAMQERRTGQIALVSSLAGFRGFAGAPGYSASKAAVRVYGESLRGDMKRYGVAVNVICPGFIKTPMTDVNPFPMPFLMTADRAARIIRRGLERNQARIAFPWRMYMLVRLVTALPQDWVDSLIQWLPKKGS